MKGFKGQCVTLSDGTKVRGKYVERCSAESASKLGATATVPEGTKIGKTYVSGKYIAVRRTAGRGGPWRQI